jgi:hypothetical protein
MPSKAGAVSINTNRGGFGDVIEKNRICFLLSEALAGPCYRRTFTADGLNQKMSPLSSKYPGPIRQITSSQCTLVIEIAFGSLCTARHFAARWSAEAASVEDAGNIAGKRVSSEIVTAVLLQLWAISDSIQGGFFLAKKPLSDCALVYACRRPAIAEPGRGTRHRPGDA